MSLDEDDLQKPQQTSQEVLKMHIGEMKMKLLMNLHKKQENKLKDLPKQEIRLNRVSRKKHFKGEVLLSKGQMQSPSLTKYSPKFVQILNRSPAYPLKGRPVKKPKVEESTICPKLLHQLQTQDKFMDKINQQIVTNTIRKEQNRKMQKSRSPSKSPGPSGHPSPGTSMTKIKLAQESPTSSDELQIHKEINLEIMASEAGDSSTKKSFLAPTGKLSRMPNQLQIPNIPQHASKSPRIGGNSMILNEPIKDLITGRFRDKLKLMVTRIRNQKDTNESKEVTEIGSIPGH